MFRFDERFAMFDITPVENQFILEYLPNVPNSKGEYVKVFLYGLMHCYHPEKDMEPARMCRELNISEDELNASLHYWERRGLVRRISDQPPAWQFQNIKQIDISGGREQPDPDYEDFCNAVCDAFDKTRRLHGSELSKISEWKEDLHLPTEVIIMLLHHMVEQKGKNFRIAEAEKAAIQMADENIRTVEDAEAFFMRDGAFYSGAKQILKKLGKRYQPSEAQVNLYRKWIEEWHFTHDAVETATGLTAKGDPSFGYLDGILNGIRNENVDEKQITPAIIRGSGQRTEVFREILKELGRGEISQRNLELFDGMKELYPREVILIAAKECRNGGKGPEDLFRLLQSWKEKGLRNEEQVKQYVDRFHDQTSLIRELRHIWGGDETRAGGTDRNRVRRWEEEYGFSREMILAVAPLASEAKQPMAYLDRILADFHEKGIMTLEEALKDHASQRTAETGGGKRTRTVTAQEYTQRDYTDVQNDMMEAQRREIEAYLSGNGGVATDA